MDASKVNALNALLATMSDEKRRLFSATASTPAPSPSITPESKAVPSRRLTEEGQGSRAAPTTPLFNPLSPIDEEEKKVDSSPSIAHSGSTSSSTASKEQEEGPIIPDLPILQAPLAEKVQKLRKRPLQASSNQSSAKKLCRPTRGLSTSSPKLPKPVSTSTTSLSLKPFRFPKPYDGDELLPLSEGRFRDKQMLEPLVVVEQELLAFVESLELSAAIDLLRLQECLHMESEPFDYDPDQVRAFYTNFSVAPALYSPGNPDLNLNEHACILWHDDESFTISPRMVGELLGLSTGGDRFAVLQKKDPSFDGPII